MMFLEYQHRPQAHGGLARPADVHADRLHLPQECVPAGRIPRDKRSLALATEVLDLVGILLRECREAVV